MWMAPMPSTISPTRPESCRAVSCRWRPSSISLRRILGMMPSWIVTITKATSPSQKFWSMMNSIAIRACPPSSAGCTNASQHPFAEAALVGVDVELEQAVHDHQEQEHHAEREKRLFAVELESGEECNFAEERQVVDHRQGWPRVA